MLAAVTVTKARRVTISLPEELADRLDRNAARDHRGKRSRAVAELIREGVTKSGERVAKAGNAADLT